MHHPCSPGHIATHAYFTYCEGLEENGAWHVVAAQLHQDPIPAHATHAATAINHSDTTHHVIQATASVDTVVSGIHKQKATLHLQHSVFATQT
jgi:hypothetical protein